MTIRTNRFSLLLKVTVFVTAVLLCNNVLAFNSNSDSSKNPLLAVLDKKAEKSFIIKEANVIYPDILSDHEEQSLDYIEKFAESRREYLLRMYTKGKKLFPKVAAVLKKQNLPQELKMLIALESAFKGNAVSKAGAVGYWQFMDETAKDYGLKVVTQLSPVEKKKLIKKDKKKADSLFKAMARQKDDRRNFNKSTYAAARYLKDRSRNLNNDLLLMVASYNCGVGNVWDAIAASGKTNATFWDIKKLLPAETRAYVMNFIAMNVIYNNYEKFCNNTLAFKPIKMKADQFDENIKEEPGDVKPAFF